MKIVWFDQQNNSIFLSKSSVRNVIKASSSFDCGFKQFLKVIERDKFWKNKSDNGWSGVWRVL